ncbi:XRE family transcriptional regulator [Fructilactobacillus frigidiflavus]|uniref:spr1629 family repressor/antitoxin n=1 Tax=Fructilactobacillus frigidiflavus TaxID=3242688 RepID=UPI003756B5E4
MDFNGTRLRDIRESFVLSRKDLSDLLNVSEQSVWQYETGLTVPSFQILSKLNNIFGVSIAFFTNKNSIPKVVNSKYIAYRSDLKRSVKNTERETTFLNVLDSFITSLIPRVNLPKEDIFELSKQTIKMKNDGCNFDEIAHFVRKRLNLNLQNKSLMAMIERSGVFIVERQLNNKVDAYSAWTDNNRPYIILGTNKSGPRRMFDLAHEFGHILLHHNLEFDESDSAYVLKLEKEANAFASSLLLDRNFYIENFNKIISDPTNPIQYLSLKKYYGVSIAALEMRASNLGLITPKQSGYFWARMTKSGYKKIEPLDDKFDMYVPGKIYAILNYLNKRKLHDLYAETGVNRSFIEKMIIRKIINADNIENDSGNKVIPLYQN